MARAYNFAPGPAALPESVLKQAQAGVGGGLVEVQKQSVRPAPFFGQRLDEQANDVHAARMMRRTLVQQGDVGVNIRQVGKTAHPVDQEIRRAVVEPETS